MKNSTAVILIIISIGLFYTFTRPTYSAVKELGVEANETRDVLKNISDIVENRDRLIVNYNAIPKTELERLDKALPQNVDTVRLALDLDAMASRYGISIDSVAIDKSSGLNSSEVILPESENPYEKTLVSVSFVSNYANFRSLLTDLEKSLRIMNVKSVQFQASETGLYRHNILIETYWVK